MQEPWPELQTTRLANGQVLAWRQWGDAQGQPVLYCHGFPACSLEAALTHEAACQLGLSIVAPDRPGYGGSPYQENRQLEHWPQQASELMSKLGYGNFLVMGFSGGGPYAAQTALLPQARGLLLVAPVHHLGDAVLDRDMALSARFLIWLSRQHPRMAQGVYQGLLGPLMYHLPTLVLSILMAVAPPADQQVRAIPAFKRMARASIRAAFRQGGRGAAQDLYIYTHLNTAPWTSISCPVALWHGLEDRTVPVQASQAYSEQIRHMQSNLISGEGHFSLPVHHMHAMLSQWVQVRG